jgi:hypothetical protein
MDGVVAFKTQIGALFLYFIKHLDDKLLMD